MELDETAHDRLFVGVVLMGNYHKRGLFMYMNQKRVLVWERNGIIRLIIFFDGFIVIDLYIISLLLLA